MMLLHTIKCEKSTRYIHRGQWTVRGGGMESGLEGGDDSDNENANTDIHTPPRRCTDLVVIGTDPRAEHGLLRGYDLLPLLQFLL